MNNKSALLRINLFCGRRQVIADIYITFLEFDERPLFGDEYLSALFAW
jgi:hypothetical protein